MTSRERYWVGLLPVWLADQRRLAWREWVWRETQWVGCWGSDSCKHTYFGSER